MISVFIPPSRARFESKGSRWEILALIESASRPAHFPALSARGRCPSIKKSYPRSLSIRYIPAGDHLTLDKSSIRTKNLRTDCLSFFYFLPFDDGSNPKNRQNEALLYVDDRPHRCEEKRRPKSPSETPS